MQVNLYWDSLSPELQKQFDELQRQDLPDAKDAYETAKKPAEKPPEKGK